MSETILELKGIRKAFDGVSVLNGIDLSIDSGEFITLLGSSGCGKTTTLRIVAGLEFPDEGSVILEGQDVTGKSPDKRDVNTVFQNYALFPHMTVAENVAYGLKELVQLAGYEKRRPAQLSGGQKQRVAIARALVNNPRVLLLDEPLGALDLQLRRQMQIELKRLQKRLGITFIYITHDQEEALNMSDRIAVMHGGVFEQIGTPDQIYDKPRTDYVAKFVGSANVICGTVLRKTGNSLAVAAENGTVFVKVGNEAEYLAGQEVRMAVRSEKLQICEADSEPTSKSRRQESREQEAAKQENEGRGDDSLKGFEQQCPKTTGIPCTVKEISFAGGMLRMAMETESGEELIASRHGIRPDQKVGDHVLVFWDPEAAVLVEKSSVEGANEK